MRDKNSMKDIEQNEKEWNLLTDEQKRERVISNVSVDFWKAMKAGDYYDASEYLGILRYFNATRYNYWRGMLRDMIEDYKGAAESYLKVEPNSDHYDQARNNLAMVYVKTGDYVALDTFYKEIYPNEIEIVQLENRMNCAQHMLNKGTLETISFENVKMVNCLGDTEREWKAYFSISNMFENMLVLAGQCINQCGIFQDRIGSEIKDFENNKDLKNIVSTYKDSIIILSFSKFMGLIKCKGADSLAEVALDGVEWPDKIRFFRGSNYVHEIIQMIYTLGNPDRFKYIDRCEAIGILLEHLFRVDPMLLHQLIDHYFMDIERSIKEGKVELLQYVGYVYTDIVANEVDPYKLDDRLKVLYSFLPEEDIKESIEWKKRTKKLSRKASDLLLHAERAFNAGAGKNPGIEDASTLALCFFRVIEYEYNYKLVRPLFKLVDIEKLKKLCGWDKTTNQKSEQEMKNYKEWGRDLSMVLDYNSGVKCNLELGTVRTLLVKINRSKGTCGNEFYNKIVQILTYDGIQALTSEKMIDLIGSYNINAYRNPGAHTGFVPYSAACKARDLVLGTMEEMESWFKGEAH